MKKKNGIKHIVVKPVNKPPWYQISKKKAEEIAQHIVMFAARNNIDTDICKDLMRIGYEVGWNHALETPNATIFRRLQ